MSCKTLCLSVGAAGGIGAAGGVGAWDLYSRIAPLIPLRGADHRFRVIQRVQRSQQPEPVAEAERAKRAERAERAERV